GGGPMDLDELKRGAATMWGLGDYRPIAEAIFPEAVALAEACDVRPGTSVLDVAAGTGNVAIAAARMGATVVASDLSPQMVAWGRERTAAEGLDVEWHEADAEDLPFEDGRHRRDGQLDRRRLLGSIGRADRLLRSALPVRAAHADGLGRARGRGAALRRARLLVGARAKCRDLPVPVGGVGTRLLPSEHRRRGDPAADGARRLCGVRRGDAEAHARVRAPAGGRDRHRERVSARGRPQALNAARGRLARSPDAPFLRRARPVARGSRRTPAARRARRVRPRPGFRASRGARATRARGRARGAPWSRPRRPCREIAPARGSDAPRRAPGTGSEASGRSPPGSA